jgi:hypothetical protein
LVVAAAEAAEEEEEEEEEVEVAAMETASTAKVEGGSFAGSVGCQARLQAREKLPALPRGLGGSNARCG